MIALVIDILSFVSVLVVVVLGMAIIVSMMGIFNLAHGQFVLLGAVVYLLAQRYGVPGFPAILVAIAVGAILGAVTERLVIRHLYAQPIAAVLATFGLGLVIQQLVRLGIGTTGQGSQAPIDAVIRLGSYQVAEWRLWVIGLAFLASLAVFLLLDNTTLGLQMRATLDDPRLARASGIRTHRIYTLTFALGAALAAFAGAIISPLTAVFPELGVSYLVLSFLAVMVGGSGTFAGPVLGAVLVGSVSELLTEFVSPVYASVLVVVGSVVFMRVRPYGLLGGSRALSNS
jgi:branched-chain amino acid transport system permease protein